MAELAIEVNNLKKTYGAIQAVKGIDLTVNQGEIFGLIGPDGAGKTSTFQILGGVMQATSGEARMFGETARDARAFVGYLTQQFSLYQDLSVTENLRYIGDLRRLSRADIETRSMRYLKMFDMDRFTDRLAGKLSGGMKQKLALACALIAEPRILLLDEPTTGVDPVSRREFWDTLVRLASDGMTIVVATPYLDEAERCNRVALMFEGSIKQVGTPAEIKTGLGLNRLEVRADNLQLLEETLDQTAGLQDVQRFGDRLDVMVSDSKKGEELIRGALEHRQLRNVDIRAMAPTLENAFVSILRDLGDDVHAAPFPRVLEVRERSADAIAIGARGLNKQFGDFHAVKDVSIEVKYGEIYGLLGANGAGKTTTIKILCGLLEPTSGSVELAGETGSLRSASLRQRIGYMSQKFSLYDDLTIGENLDFFAGVYKVSGADRAKKKEWVLSFSGLEKMGGLMTGSLPGGWKQRVAFGAAVMHEPRVLFLDEPTSGVDPLARRAFWKMIGNFADHGVAVLVTTHYLEEAEQCNRLGMMVAGELVAQGTPTGLKAAQQGHMIEMITDRPPLADSVLKQTLDRWRVSLFGDRLHVVVDDEVSTAIKRLTDVLSVAGIKVIRAYEESFSLEDVFIGIVERSRLAGYAIAE